MAAIILVAGLVISFVFTPAPALICGAVGLMILHLVESKAREPHEDVLQQFARSRNWYYPVGTYLRNVSGRRRRVRFYTPAPLLSMRGITDRLLANDFSPRPAQPTGEVPRKVRDANFFPADIPPAGWNSNPIRPAVSFDKCPIQENTPGQEVSVHTGEDKPASAPVKAPIRRVASKPKERPSQDNSESAPGLEGERRLETNYAIVRDKKLRAAAIRIHGRDCCVCGANFDRTYGKNLAKGYIEVHHLKSISAGVRNTNPATDLVPLCANCHKMADRLASQSESPPASIDELKRMLLQKTTASRKPKTSTKSAAVTTKITKASSKPRKTTPDKSL